MPIERFLADAKFGRDRVHTHRFDPLGIEQAIHSRQDPLADRRPSVALIHWKPTSIRRETINPDLPRPKPKSRTEQRPSICSRKLSCIRALDSPPYGGIWKQIGFQRPGGHYG